MYITYKISDTYFQHSENLRCAPTIRAITRIH